MIVWPDRSDHLAFRNKLSRALGFYFGLSIAMACQPGNRSAAPGDSIPLNKDSIPAERIIVQIDYNGDPQSRKWFQYDSSGRLTAHGMHTDSIQLVYSPNLIIRRHLKPEGHWNAETVYQLDGQGRVMNSTIRDDQARVISRLEYQYGASGYLIRTKQVVLATGKTYFRDYHYADGNLVRLDDRNAEGEMTSSYHFQYDPERPFRFNIDVQSFTEEYFASPALGPYNKNLLKQSFQLSAIGDTLSLLRYSYPDSGIPDRFKIIIEDLLNENTTEVTIHIKP